MFPVLPFCVLRLLGSDAQPLTQMNPKKKIFETIQPGTEACLLSIVSKFKQSAFLRVYNIRYKGGSVDQPSHPVNSQDPYEGRHLCRSKLRRSVIIVENKIVEI